MRNNTNQNVVIYSAQSACPENTIEKSIKEGKTYLGIELGSTRFKSMLIEKRYNQYY